MTKKVLIATMRVADYETVKAQHAQTTTPDPFVTRSVTSTYYPKQGFYLVNIFHEHHVASSNTIN